MTNVMRIHNDPSAGMTKMIMQLFTLWKLTYQQQAALLSLSAKTNTTIARFKKGQSKLFFDRDKEERVGHLLAIHKYLRQLFPLNQNLVYQWPTTPNKAFRGKTPVELMVEEGFLGVVRVRRYLENYVGS